jgi:hypothetical protein
MNNERDPELEVLFADAAAESPNGDFQDKVMTGVATRRRNVMLGRIAIVALIVLLEVLLSAPLQSTVGVIVDVLGSPLIELSQPMLAMILAPVNSIAGVVGGVLLLVHFLYRRLLR